MHLSAPPASVEKAPSRPNPRPRTTDVAACQNDESCFLLAENGGQNCAKLVFERFGRNKKNTLLRAIPTVAFFVIVSDISSGSIYGIYFLTFFSDIFFSGFLSVFYSGILFGILPGIFSDIFSGILCHSMWHPFG